MVKIRQTGYHRIQDVSQSDPEWLQKEEANTDFHPYLTFNLYKDFLMTPTTPALGLAC